jgi:aspartate aminotransferase
MPSLADRVKLIKPSPTLAVSAKAKAMKAQGLDVIDFGAGEPDFDTPEFIKQAAIKALHAGFTKYTAAGGIDELKDAVVKKLKDDHGLGYERSQVLISCGAKHSLYNLFQAVLNPGDEIVIPAPYWVSYPDMALLAGAKPVFVSAPESKGFKIGPEQLAGALSPKTKLVVINSPSNPTGAAYTAAELKALARVLEDRDLFAVSDECYEKMVFGGYTHVSIAGQSSKLKEKTIVVNAVSKTYSMTGWRIGYAAGPKDVIAAMTNLQSQSTSNPTSFAQKGALAALTGPQDEVGKMVAEFEKRRDFTVATLRSMPKVTCSNPEGAFYVLPGFHAYLGKKWKGGAIADDLELCRFLLEEMKVAAVPGSAFGAPGHIRLSYATSMKNLEEGLKRIREGLARL